ncbi:YeeE/YedE family protein [Microbulbifer hainanensis]|uniref:YeeE/YedE family protein n=1 Tax=Microbulbifer hainanensis TaxID=2735675 RepID=UPI0018669B4E|nr:YeeE/YedE family protein [Microbulbifer hainanensis]
MNKTTVTALVSGLLFGLGLLLSGMANPEKVLGFLDLLGAWDPSLALVMGGAIAVGLPVFFIAGRRGRTLLGDQIQMPTRRDIDRPLVVGSLLFGMGWGLAGFCPGPAVVATGAGEPKALIFTVAMLVGMILFQLTQRRAQTTQSGAQS